MSWPHREAQVGVWVKIPAVEVVEALAAGGIDFIAVDAEHGAIDRRQMFEIVGMAKALSLDVVVRVAGRGPADLQGPLDAGADALLIPHVDSAADARDVVRSGRFPPLGYRGGSPATRVGRWGLASTSELVRRGNQEVALIAQIETPAAVEHIDEILAVDGLDGVMLGPFDLALSSGRAPGDPAFEGWIRTVEDAADGNAVLGGVAGPASDPATLFARGYSFALAGADTSMLNAAAASLVEGR